MSEAAKVAVKLKDSADLMVDLLESDAPMVLIETEWNLIQHAYDKLRHALEKKVSEG